MATSKVFIRDLTRKFSIFIPALCSLPLYHILGEIMRDLTVTNQPDTAFNAYSLLLFCGSIDLDTTGRGLIVDGWLRLRGWARIGVLVSRLRMMVDEIIAARIDNPASLSIDRAGKDDITGRVIEVVKRLIELNGLDQ